LVEENNIHLDVYGHQIPTMQSESIQRIDDLATPFEIDYIVSGCTKNKNPYHLTFLTTPIPGQSKNKNPHPWGY
jgi:hypothetical protein